MNGTRLLPERPPEPPRNPDLRRLPGARRAVAAGCSTIPTDRPTFPLAGRATPGRDTSGCVRP